jgi:hypothetical protein
VRPSSVSGRGATSSRMTISVGIRNGRSSCARLCGRCGFPGLASVILGLESPQRDTLLEAGKKFVQSDTYEWRIRKIESFGISLWGAFIFGFDHDTWQDCLYACRFAQRVRLAMSCYPILTPYPGTEFYRQFAREGRLRTLNWERYNGAAVVFEPRRMTAKQLRHAQMAAFAEFFSPRSALRRLGVYPLKSRAWAANLAIWKGIRYYYAKKGRQVPTFRDFLRPDARAWNYPDEAWATEPVAEATLAGLKCPDFDDLASAARMASDPLVQAGLVLTPDGG